MGVTAPARDAALRVLFEVGDGAGADELERGLRAALDAAPPDVVLQVRAPPRLASALPASRLRALVPTGANVTLSVRPRGRPRSRGDAPQAALTPVARCA